MRRIIHRNSGARTLIGAFLLTAIALTVNASDQVPGKPQDHPIALVGGTIHTVSGSTIENGTVLFVDGKISGIGTQVDLPAGTEQINISGKHVYP